MAVLYLLICAQLREVPDLMDLLLQLRAELQKVGNNAECGNII